MTRTDSKPARLGVLLVSLLIAGCGAHTSQNEQKCALELVLNVSPLAATVDHSLSPGNSQQFTAAFNYSSVPPGRCPVPLLSLKADVTWSLSDSSNAEISNAQDATNGLATCTWASLSPITVTAVSIANDTQGPAQTATATLVCK
ncbi:MAG TPA: hypothetical protein VJQ54_18185 [Candidatus Sulfotelmatobacter sp.]|nr:hypothetical protein [Candidatus Sulfotelmatobacter sp.]